MDTPNFIVETNSEIASITLDNQIRKRKYTLRSLVGINVVCLPMTGGIVYLFSMSPSSEYSFIQVLPSMLVYLLVIHFLIGLISLGVFSLIVPGINSDGVDIKITPDYFSLNKWFIPLSCLTDVLYEDSFLNGKGLRVNYSYPNLSLTKKSCKVFNLHLESQEYQELISQLKPLIEQFKAMPCPAIPAWPTSTRLKFDIHEKDLWLISLPVNPLDTKLLSTCATTLVLSPDGFEICKDPQVEKLLEAKWHSPALQLEYCPPFHGNNKSDENNEWYLILFNQGTEALRLRAHDDSLRLNAFKEYELIWLHYIVGLFLEKLKSSI